MKGLLDFTNILASTALKGQQRNDLYCTNIALIGAALLAHTLSFRLLCVPHGGSMSRPHLSNIQITWGSPGEPCRIADETISNMLVPRKSSKKEGLSVRGETPAMSTE